jgi:hypothetical protein
MPNETMEQRLARAQAAMRSTHEYWKSRKRGA